MSHVPHELSEDFPEDREILQHLKRTNPHFSRLVNEYHEINRALHRVEIGLEPSDDAHLKEMHWARMVLKDEIAVFIADAR
ncbi:YdcH family protein [Algicella marina]|uniref:DUF465 domain-containing protein n=1 Tax=Algicella marina TaxID=2683284 RepID=A0A6P1T4F9_9RHOB|nr:DUF465 domain-containing protein [Algicella marina]QHQ36149.1 DUF465 domain-containing protein [Algicella marina]